MTLKEEVAIYDKERDLASKREREVEERLYDSQRRIKQYEEDLANLKLRESESRMEINVLMKERDAAKEGE